MATPKLKEIRLPAGDVRAINIGWYRNSAELQLDWHSWIDEGFDGVRIIGAGVDKTLVVGNMYDGTAVAIGRHPGIVQLEAMTIHAGFSMGVQAGEQNLARVLQPKFQVRYKGVRGWVPPPIPGFQRTKWFDFSYNADKSFEDTEIDATLASEHASYNHGFAKLGLLARRLHISGSGSQNLKVRSDATETAYAGPACKIRLENSIFERWFQEWADRGGGGFVAEGGASIIEIEGCFFRGGGNLSQHARCIMISSEANSYDWATGRVGIGHGNGPVSIKNTAISGRAPNLWGNELVRCGRNGGTQLSAPAFLLEASGGYGHNMIVQLGQIPKGKAVIRGCNTPEIRERCSQISMNVAEEATYPSPTRLIPLSEDLSV